MEKICKKINKKAKDSGADIAKNAKFSTQTCLLLKMLLLHVIKKKYKKNKKKSNNMISLRNSKLQKKNYLYSKILSKN